MKLYAALALLVLLAACSKPDKEAIIGKWKFSRMEQNNIVLLSTDKTEEKKIVDRFVKQNKDLFKTTKMTESKFRENVKTEITNMLSVYFEFKADSTILVENNHPNVRSTDTWKYQINEDKKEMTVEEPNRKIVYKYELEDGKLTLKTDKEKITFVPSDKK